MADEEPRPELEAGSDGPSGQLPDDHVHRCGSLGSQRLSHGGQCGLGESGLIDVIVPGDEHVLGDPDATFLECQQGTDGHAVVGRHERVEHCSTLDELVHCLRTTLVLEVGVSDEPWVTGQAVPGQNLAEDREALRGVGVLRRAPEVGDTSSPMHLDHVLDHGGHPGSVVDRDAGHARNQHAQAADRQGAALLTQGDHGSQASVRRETW
jgi:hypothetical protein